MALTKSCVPDMNEGEHFDRAESVGGQTPHDITKPETFRDAQKQAKYLLQNGDSPEKASYDLQERSTHDKRKKQSKEHFLDEETEFTSSIETDALPQETLKGTKIKLHVSVVAPLCNAENGSTDTIVTSVSCEPPLQNNISSGKSASSSFEPIYPGAGKQGRATSAIPVQQDLQEDDAMSTAEEEASPAASKVAPPWPKDGALQENVSPSNHLYGAELFPRDQVEPANAEYLEAEQRRQRPQRQPHLSQVQPGWLDIERELGFRVRDENGDVDLAFAREQRRRSVSCLACWQNPPQVTIEECGHSVLCRRCFFDPGFFSYQGMPCPRCSKPSTGLRFSPDLLNIVFLRSQFKEQF